MGQQQLLLLVLGIVIVGLAVLVGINAFSEGQKQSNADALVSAGVRIANHGQAWALRHSAFGGPADGEDIGDMTYEDIGYTHISGTYTNAEGTFTLASATSCLLITGTNTTLGNTVYLRVTGTQPDQIETEVNPESALTCS